jgi:hypothetical protein
MYFKMDTFTFACLAQLSKKVFCGVCLCLNGFRRRLYKVVQLSDMIFFCPEEYQLDSHYSIELKVSIAMTQKSYNMSVKVEIAVGELKFSRDGPRS